MKSILSEERDIKILITSDEGKTLYGFENIREVHIVAGDLGGGVAIFAEEADAKAFEAMRAETNKPACGEINPEPTIILARPEWLDSARKLLDKSRSAENLPGNL